MNARQINASVASSPTRTHCGRQGDAGIASDAHPALPPCGHGRGVDAGGRRECHLAQPGRGRVILFRPKWVLTANEGLGSRLSSCADG